MQWEGGAESSNVEDRRGMSTGGKVAIGGGGSILLLILGLIFGGDITGGRGVRQGGGGAPPPDDRTKHFAATILGFTERVWDKEFQKPENRFGMRYEKPKLVLFSNAVDTGCGHAPSEVGPFYCPADKTVYLDPTFFDELQERLGGSKAEFSQAYVIAHEVGHHVQNLLGYNELVEKERRHGKEAANHASVRLELMADYLAGAWAYHGQKEFHFIEPGDFESAITSAKAIGDDRLQKRSRGWASPESYTHGTSKQRVYFFTKGFKTGDVTRKTLDKFFQVQMNSRGELEEF